MTLIETDNEKIAAEWNVLRAVGEVVRLSQVLYTACEFLYTRNYRCPYECFCEIGTPPKKFARAMEKLTCATCRGGTDKREDLTDPVQCWVEFFTRLEEENR